MESSPSFVFCGRTTSRIWLGWHIPCNYPIFGLSYLFRVPLMIFRGLFKKKQQAETKQLDVLYQSITHIMPYAQIFGRKKSKWCKKPPDSKLARFWFRALSINQWFFLADVCPQEPLYRSKLDLQWNMASNWHWSIAAFLLLEKTLVVFYPRDLPSKSEIPDPSLRGKLVLVGGRKKCVNLQFFLGVKTKQHRVCWNFCLRIFMICGLSLLLLLEAWVGVKQHLKKLACPQCLHQGMWRPTSFDFILSKPAPSTVMGVNGGLSSRYPGRFQFCLASFSSHSFEGEFDLDKFYTLEN